MATLHVGAGEVIDDVKHRNIFSLNKANAMTYLRLVFILAFAIIPACNKNMEIELKFGKSKSTSEITLEELARYPIWVSNLAIEDQQDDVIEDEYRPLLVGSDLDLEKLQLVVIALKVQGSDRYALGMLDSKNPDKLKSIGILGASGWRKADWYFPPNQSLILESIPSISGMKRVMFRLNHASEWDATLVK